MNMIGYGPNLVEAICDIDGYTCTKVVGTDEKMELTFVPEELDQRVVMDFVNADWQDVFADCPRVVVTDDTCTLYGISSVIILDQLQNDWGDIYNVEMQGDKTVISYKPMTTPVDFDVEVLTEAAIKAHLTDMLEWCQMDEALWMTSIQDFVCDSLMLIRQLRVDTEFQAYGTACFEQDLARLFKLAMDLNVEELRSFVKILTR
jgi:hypothetical protein